MKSIAVSVLAAVGLFACAGQPRTGPPAPIESTSTRYTLPPEVAEPAPPPPPPEKTVELYAYRPPASAPDAVAPEGVATGGEPEATPPPAAAPAAPARSGPAAPVPSERATPKPAAAEGTASKSTATATPKPRPPAASAPQVVAYVPPPAPKLPPAADALAKQAEQQRRSGDFVGAAATLERALGIEPQDASQKAYLWNRLARVRKEQGLQAQAGNMAARSNALAKDQPKLKQDNWGIIAGARRAAGDATGAAEAERKARGG